VAQVRDETSRYVQALASLGVGEHGEFMVQGPLAMDGYRDLELTQEAFRGGWLHTGDVAVRDPDGFLRSPKSR